MRIDTLTIVGVGLIGGSIGLAAKARGLVRCVRGVGRQQVSLDQALNVGAIDEAFLTLPGAVRGADLIVFCTPVDLIAEQILEALPHCSPGTLITDAGSTKALIVQKVETGIRGQGAAVGNQQSAVSGQQAAGSSRQSAVSTMPPAFVGSHPLAGSEKRGPGYADAQLFQDRWTVVTPTVRTDQQALETITAFWQALGSKIKVMDPEKHDQALARTSHLPHLLASALAGSLPGDLFDLAASGFRDTTRIAAGDPQLWTAIFQQNQAALLQALKPFEEKIQHYRQSIEKQDWHKVRELLLEAKKVRDALGS